MGNLSELLRFDPIATAEELTGKHHSDRGTGMVGLSLAMKHAAVKRKAIADAGDTQFSSGLSEYVDLIERRGFRKSFERMYEDGTRLCVYCMGGLALKFDTFNGYGKSSDESINSATVYYNVMVHDIDGFFSSGAISTGGMKGNVWVGNHDAREALFHKIERLSLYGDVLDRWEHRPFLWLLHYSESKVDGYDYKELTENVINEASSTLRDIINGAV